MKIIDISRDMLETEIYPGDPEPRLHLVEQLENGDNCNLTALYFCLHTGTHADAPLHFIEDGNSIDMLDPAAFIGPCTVIEVPAGPIRGDYVDAYFPSKCERLLIKCNGKAWFLESGAFEAVGLGLKLIGTDSLSVGTKGDQTAPHKAFLSSDVAILEGLDLSEVVPGDYFLFAPPVKIGGREAAPARAILIDDYLFWGGKSN